MFVFSVNSAPKWKTPSTATSTLLTPTCFGIPASCWKPSPTLQPTTSTTLWWERSSTTAPPTATASWWTSSWMFAWTTGTRRGASFLPLFMTSASISSCFGVCFQGERHRNPVCGADRVLPLLECRVARHPQGSLLLLQQRQLWFQRFTLQRGCKLCFPLNPSFEDPAELHPHFMVLLCLSFVSPRLVICLYTIPWRPL